ncbi:MAG: tRNA pseudouridine(55) synthase TruB [Clostridiales bacterium]|nr:tRNA pseudouridine(55) synthase TruB [Clostridiales bacterium]
MTGILPLDKPEGMTSFSAVARVRRMTGEKKSGHAGTLDPMATGVLPVLLGGATRFLDFLPGEQKEYTAVFQLGIRTDTLDSTGTVLERRPVTAAASDVEAVLPRFIGEIEQIPPMYSAVSQDGKRLYELARQGIKVARPARRVTVASIVLEQADEANGRYTITVVCGKGTYIRTLCDDIGRALGCFAAMTALRRRATCGFSLEQCVALEDLERAAANGTVEQLLIPVEQALCRYPRAAVSPAQATRFQNGGALDLVRLQDRLEPGLYRVFSLDGVFLGLGEADLEQGQLKVKRVMRKREN